MIGLVTVGYFVAIYFLENVETQQYVLVEKHGDFEIRSYGKSIVAKTTASGTYDESKGENFGKLAGYIFGDNKESKKIAMTAPVWMSTDTTNSEMQFIMPSEYEKSELPAPSSSAVQLDYFEGGQFAAIRFGGYASDAKISEHTEKLLSWLSANNYSFRGETFFVGYNSPFKVFNRRNEVLISLN